MTPHELILTNLPLVPHIARRVFPSGYADPNVRAVGTWDDLISEGNMALCKAAQHFDPARGFRFTTYAYRCIYLALLKHVLNYTGLIRGPKRQRFDEASYQQMRRLTPRVTLHPERLAEALAPQPLEDLPSEIERILPALPPEESSLLYAYYWEGQTYAQIGRRWGVSRQAIGLRLRKLLAKLRYQLAENRP